MKNISMISEKETLEKILNTLDSYVYVTDLETDEILFVNQKMEKDFNLGESTRGDQCWRLLQEGQTERCDFCKKPFLAAQPDMSVTWEEENPITGSTLLNIDRIIDWPGGRKVHMQQCVDITEIRRTQNMLETINKAMMILLTRAESSFEGAMTEGIELISGIVNIDRMSVFCNFDRPDGRHLSQIYRWTKETGGMTKVLDFFIDAAYASLSPRWESILAAGDCVSGAVRHMPEADLLRPFGCVTVMAVPVFAENKFWGFVFFERMTENDFTDYEADTLRSTSFLLANMVIRHRMMRKIEKQSHLLQTVNQISAVMMESSAESFARDLTRSLGMLAEATDVDRVYVWKNSMRGGCRHSRQIYEWSEKAEPLQDTVLAEERPLCEILPGAEAALARGEHISGIVCDMDPALQEQFEPQAIQVILLMPIFLKEEFWGFIGFDNCHSKEVFSDSEERTLRSASELIAEALIRNNIEENLRNSAMQLQMALAEAQSASNAKSEFLSRMSHEMRTPMNAIVGMTGIARGTADHKKKDVCLDKIDIASKHLLGVINDVLDMSKIEANKFELDPHVFRFEKMLEGVTDVLSFRIGEKKQQFLVSLDEKIPANVIGDELRITQVITNLLSNAVKFTPEGGTVKLSVACLEDGVHASRVLIEVTDTGIGITPEQRPRLFSAFEQADGSIVRKFGGTGLGLAISKHIVELMGGEIGVESVPGQGSKFYFTLTLPKGNESVVPPRADIAEVKGKHHILIAEDIEINRMVISELLEGTGIGMDMAENGAEAVRMFEAEPSKYSLILMDIQMPEIDGYDATRRIRALPGRKAKEIPIIAMTANVFKEDVEACLAAGLNDHIGKPIEVSLLFEKLNQYLNK